MNRARRALSAVAVVAVVALVAGACNVLPGASTAGTRVRLQLQWVNQSQFAGYYAAEQQGYYDAEGLDVELIAGGPNVVPQQVGSAADGPEFTIAWLPKVLEARESTTSPSDLVNIAQVFQRSGTLSVSWKESNITSPEQFEGKKVGVWDFGNDHEVIVAGRQAGLEPNQDYERVIQEFNMNALLARQIDVAEAMIYNEYAQVLEAVDPETGELYQPDDLNIIDYNDVGTAMLQDGIYARKAWLDQAGNADIATKFLKASFRGWIYCRDNQDQCVQYALAAGTQLGAGHQAWVMNEINPLIWPSPNGIGMMDPAEFAQTVEVAKSGAVIKADPSADAYRTDLAEAALASITEDKNGANFQKKQVEITEGGN
jgi:NitT/TauT family transport system substrate-binding protein